MRDFFVHESCIIDKGAEVGEGTKIWHFSHIMAWAKIGKNCTIGQNVFVASGVKIGNNCKIQNNVSVYKGVQLEDDVFCGPSLVFTNNLTPRAFIESDHETRLTLVKQGSSLGANATILWGVTVGRYSLVGAGAVVTKDVRDYALVIGVPAVRTGWVCRCGIVLTPTTGLNLGCEECGNLYREENGSLYPVEEK